jgi:hypothetical protein
MTYGVMSALRHPASGFYDPAVMPDPRGWLEARLGPLAEFEHGS